MIYHIQTVFNSSVHVGYLLVCILTYLLSFSEEKNVLMNHSNCIKTAVVFHVWLTRTQDQMCVNSLLNNEYSLIGL